jgi:hypothetical protein
MGAAELAILVILFGIIYAALAPLRRSIERRFLRKRGGKRTATVIPLVRRSDGVFATREKEKDHGHQR